MFRKHPLRDFMLFLIIGITVTFGFNVRAVETKQSAFEQIIQQDMTPLYQVRSF